ncbi:hypothetical protein [Lacibacter sp. H407]|uniref:hypothetical protein n=1 Tax=Lacibacter sp. H407 TaxID=3133423 RepID=UPI0030C12E4E
MRKQFIHWIFFCLALVSGAAVHAQSKDFQLRIDNYRGTIQWQQSPDHINWTNIVGATVSNLTTYPAVTTYYRAVISEPNCTDIYSNIKAAYIQGDIVLSAELIKGIVTLPTGSAYSLSDLKAYSLIDSCKLGANGNFELLKVDSSSENLLIVTNQNKDVCLLGVFLESQNQYELNTETTTAGLLLMYPFLKQVNTERKKQLLIQYKNEPEFTALKQEVQAVHVAGKKLFDSAYTQIGNLVVKLIKKSYNNDRYRLSSNDLDVEVNGGNVIIRNNKEFSYVGSVYPVGNNNFPLLTNFVVAGSLLRSSNFIQGIRPYLSSSDHLTTEDMKSERILNLRSIGASPNQQYKIILRTGLALDLTPEDQKARRENLLQLYLALLDNVSPEVGSIKKINAKCVTSAVDYLTETTKIKLTQNPNTDVVKDIIIPYLSEAFSTIGECFGSLVESVFGMIFKIVDLFVNIEEKASAMTFYPEWVSSPKKADICLTIDTKERVYYCAVVENLGVVKDEYPSGETVELKVRTLYDPQYYPYELFLPLPLAAVNFQIQEGTSSFLPGEVVKLDEYTDIDGVFSLQWKMPCEIGKTSVLITPLANPISKTKESSTNVFHPTVAITALNTDVQGSPNQKIDKNLILKFNDVRNGQTSPIASENFNVEWRNVKGTGTIAPASSLLNESSFSWTLGPEDGEQIVEATIKSKNCDWPISENVISFSAKPEVFVLSGFSFANLSDVGTICSYYKSCSYDMKFSFKDNKSPTSGSIMWKIDWDNDGNGTFDGTTGFNSGTISAGNTDGNIVTFPKIGFCWGSNTTKLKFFAKYIAADGTEGSIIEGAVPQY